jgi:hypothetical protein
LMPHQKLSLFVPSGPRITPLYFCRPSSELGVVLTCWPWPGRLSQHTPDGRLPAKDAPGFSFSVLRAGRNKCARGSPTPMAALATPAVSSHYRRPPSSFRRVFLARRLPAPATPPPARRSFNFVAGDTWGRQCPFDDLTLVFLSISSPPLILTSPY